MRIKFEGPTCPNDIVEIIKIILTEFEADLHTVNLYISFRSEGQYYEPKTEDGEALEWHIPSHQKSIDKIKKEDPTVSREDIEELTNIRKRIFQRCSCCNS